MCLSTVVSEKEGHKKKEREREKVTVHFRYNLPFLSDLVRLKDVRLIPL